MTCPACKHNEDTVLESRQTSNGFVIRRRRKCNNCGERFTTYEEEEIYRNSERSEYVKKKVIGLQNTIQQLQNVNEQYKAQIAKIEKEYDEMKSRMMGSLDEIVKKLGGSDAGDGRK